MFTGLDVFDSLLDATGLRRKRHQHPPQRRQSGVDIFRSSSLAEECSVPSAEVACHGALRTPRGVEEFDVDVKAAGPNARNLIRQSFASYASGVSGGTIALSSMA